MLHLYYKGSSSTPLPVLSGVPQGSVLGPLLFLIYVNDILASIQYSSVFLFADDAKLLKAIQCNTDASILQEDLDSLNSWSAEWLLSLNALKCSHFSFSYSDSVPSQSSFTTGGITIPTASTYKDLGVKICSNLSWSDHVSSLCSKAYTAFHVINLPPSAAPGLRKKLYLSLVRSNFAYCSQLWRPLLLKDISCLEKVQRRATKYILNNYSSPYRNRLLALDLLPLSLWLELLDLLFLVKCLLAPPDNFNIREYITFVEGPTRAGSCGKLTHNYSRTSAGRHFYFNRVVRLWNTVPPIDLEAPCSVTKVQITTYFWYYFTTTFDQNNKCSYHIICCPCPNCHQKS